MIWLRVLPRIYMLNILGITYNLFYSGTFPSPLFSDEVGPYGWIQRWSILCEVGNVFVTLQHPELLVQGHMSLCLHIMLICSTIIFHTQKEPLNNKNVGANFLEIFLPIFLAFLHNNMCTNYQFKYQFSNNYLIIIFVYIWWTMSYSTSKWSVLIMAYNRNVRKMVRQTGGGGSRRHSPPPHFFNRWI